MLPNVGTGREDPWAHYHDPGVTLRRRVVVTLCVLFLALPFAVMWWKWVLAVAGVLLVGHF
jgi:hypothetical protein